MPDDHFNHNGDEKEERYVPRLTKQDKPWWFWLLQQCFAAYDIYDEISDYDDDKDGKDDDDDDDDNGQEYTRVLPSAGTRREDKKSCCYRGTVMMMMM